MTDEHGDELRSAAQAEADDIDEIDEIDERPQRRREWSGALRSVVLPIVTVAAIVGAIWYIEQRDEGGSAAGDGDTGVVERPDDARPDGVGVSAEEGKVAPDFVLETIEGGTVRLSDYTGQPVFINFWATWCTPCRKEMPDIVAAYDRYSADGLVVVAVNVEEDLGSASTFAAEFGMDFPTVLDFSGDVAATYRVTGMPTSYFVDREGVIREVIFGPLSGDDMIEQIEKIL